MPEQVKDPVCGMTIDKEQAAATAEHQGQTYYFCSPGCKVEFEKNPEKYAGAAGQEHSHGGH